jgi:hypothetical protein
MTGDPYGVRKVGSNTNEKRYPVATLHSTPA